MGSHYVSYHFDASDEKTLHKSYGVRVQEELYSHGHDSYSGVLNQSLRVLSTVFADEDKATDWIQSNTDKFGYALAARVGDFKKAFFNTSKGSKLLAQVAELKDKVDNFDRHLLDKLKTQKSQFKACPHCQSKIHVQSFVRHHQSTACPVCTKEMLKTPTHIEQQRQLYKKLQEKQIELQQAKKAHEQKLGNKNPCWLVGGWARS